MNINFQDPMILIPAGVILVGVVFFFWAVGRLFKKSEPSSGFDDLSLPPVDDPFTGRTETPATPPYPDFAAPPPTPPPSTRPMSPTRESGTPPTFSAVSREMVDRLDGMSQRLNDMQGVLQRQASLTASGTPLTPETIDKLLKIVGNVTQQVDLLQRSLGVTPSAPVASPTPAAPAPAFGMPKPVPAPAPVPTTPPAAAPPKPGIVAEPTSKGVGLAGGALSKFGKPVAPPSKTSPGGTPPPIVPPPPK